MNSSRAYRLVLLLVVASGLAACYGKRAWHSEGADQKTSSETCQLSEEDAAGVNGDVSTDVHAANTYRETVAHIFEKDQIGELDCLASRARSNKERFLGGAWKLHELYKAISKPFQYPVHSTDEDWESLLRRLQRWQAADPQSITVHIALAEAYIGYAASARGYGADNTVSESALKLIAERAREAKKVLQGARSLPSKDPEWYAAMLEVAGLQHWTEADKRSLLHKMCCIFLNVLVAPWGLAQTQQLWDVLLSIPLVLFKIFLFLLALVVIESSLAMLRLFRITEFLGAAFATAVAAMITKLLLM